MTCQKNFGRISFRINFVFCCISEGLLAHWRDNELVRIGQSFDSIAAHNSAFFLLAVEESRENLRDDSDSPSEEDSLPSSSSSATVGRKTAAIWKDCEVTGIISESEYGGLPKACDPRLGSVWAISVSIIPPVVSSLDHAVGPSGGDNDERISGGDLMLLYRSHQIYFQGANYYNLPCLSAQWNHSLLGVVQPWDPDYDVKFGSHLGINNFSSGGTGTKSCNLLVCIDQPGSSSSSSVADIGGWAEQGTIFRGVKFSMTLIGTQKTFP